MEIEIFLTDVQLYTRVVKKNNNKINNKIKSDGFSRNYF